LNKLAKIIAGIVLIAIGIYVVLLWWPETMIIVRGGLGLALIVSGLICFAFLE
jgi:hypothetical protein